MTRFVLLQPKARRCRSVRSRAGAENWELENWALESWEPGQKRAKPSDQAETQRSNRCSK
jgi:hypothetical protein